MNVPDCLGLNADRRIYIEKTFKGTQEEYLELLKNSSTLYVSNIRHTMAEEQIWELFGMCGEIKRVIRGINRKRKTACDFVFIEYYSKDEAENAMKILKGLEICGRRLIIEKDMGFIQGREYGRGIFGGKLKTDMIGHKKMVKRQ